MSLNPLSIFYSVPRWELYPAGYIQITWKCDPAAITAIGQAGNLNFSGVSLTNLQEVNNYVDRQLITDRQLTTVVVANLYQIVLAQQNFVRNNCWFNFIAAMTLKAALHSWHKVPKSQQSEELFERLITPNLSIQQLLASFNPEYHPNLLVGLQAWTYQAVRYNSFAYLRKNGDPYFGLSNFGVVARSSWAETRMALLGNISSEQVGSYLAICKIFKNYLGRSKIRVNKLESQHWQEILAELSSMSIELTIEELSDRIDRVGSLIRAHASPKIDKYDDPNLFIPIDDRLDSSKPDMLDLDAALDRIFRIIDLFIHDLPIETQSILILRHQQKLTQVNIAKQISKDQSKISRKLGEIYLDLLDLIHLQIDHPDGGKAKKNSQAINAIKQLLEKYFYHDRATSIT
jgi:hypothetical protein